MNPDQKVSYRAESSISKQLYQRALRVMPGGNTRHSIALAPYPVYARSGRGCRVIDVEGEERIDFLNNFTSLIRGHADLVVARAVHERIDLGTAFTMPTAADVELAELIVDRVPYIDQVRFCNSGSEAVMLTIKAARAFTGRHKIAKFEGAYHGIYDYAQVSEGSTPDDWGEADAPASVLEHGAPPSIADDVIVLPWNNFKACEALIAARRDELAAVLVDPLPLGIGFIAPRPGFIELLREITERFGVLLISDEVLNFRLSYHGAMTEFGIAPDLTAMGKIIGGGFPVGAVAGRGEVMSVFDHTGDLKLHHGGTYNANPVTMTAGLATMKQMTGEEYERLNRLGDYIRRELREMLGERGLQAQVNGKGSLFLAVITDNELIDYRSLLGSYSRSNPAFGKLNHEMLARGIITSPRGIFGCLSTPMTESELDAFVEAVDESLAALNVR